MNDLEHQLQDLLKQALRFRLPLFLAMLAIVYGFILWRVSTLSDVPPAPDALSQAISASPHIDQATVDKVKQLQDNSVNVRALFDHARKNPFKE